VLCVFAVKKFLVLSSDFFIFLVFLRALGGTVITSQLFLTGGTNEKV
jgi:hypothetical protein